MRRGISFIKRESMSQTSETFRQGLLKAIEESKTPLPKPWALLDATHTFQDALDLYATYYSSLETPAQKEAMSVIFNDQIKKLGTPIIEDSSADECDVYFLFPKERLLDSEENPGTKKDLYLQGDFHGYDTTEDKHKNRVTELNDTGMMLHKAIVPKDAIVTYRYIQLEPSLRNRTPTQHHGSEAIEEPPTSYFSTESKVEKPEIITPQTKNASNEFWGEKNQLEDEYSDQRPLFLLGPKSTERVFRVNADKALARLPREKVDWPSLLSSEKIEGSKQTFIYHDTLYSDKKVISIIVKRQLHSNMQMT